MTDPKSDARAETSFYVEDGALFLANRDLRMDMVMPAGEVSDPRIATRAHSSRASLLTSHVALHVRNGSAKFDNSAAATAEMLKSAHYGRPRHVSLDERSLKLTPLSVESFGCLDKRSGELADQMAISVVGGGWRRDSSQGHRQ